MPASTRRLISAASLALVLRGLVVIVFLAVAANDLFRPEAVQAQMAEAGFAPNLTAALGVIALVCGIVYAIPATAVLGAILITGYLGGAICTHFRLGEIGSPPQIVSTILGFMTWGGLYLSNDWLRNLLPMVRRDDGRARTGGR